MKLAVLSRLGTRFRMLYLLLGAAFTALTLIFPQIGLLEWITMIPLMIGVYRLCEDSTCSLKKAYGYGFVTVYVFYFIIYHWITYLYPLDFLGMDAGSSLAVIAAGWLGLPLLQALLGGFLFLLFRLLHKIGLFAQKPLLRPFLFAALWVIFEWSSTLHWTGVPWGRLALGQIKMLPMLQSASLFGSYFVSFLILAVNGLLAYAIVFSEKRRFCAFMAAGILAGNLGYSVMMRFLPAQERAEDFVCAAVLQPNIGSQEKWSNAEGLTMERCEEFTRKAAEEGAELVVMPETVLPVELTNDDYASGFFSYLAREYDVYLIVGAFYTDANDEEYNALYLYSPDGEMSETVYGKRHLVPFGEYVPMRDFVSLIFPPLADISMLSGDLMPGKDSALFETEWGRVGSLICFDSIYEQLNLDSVRDGADLMVISSNDSWFFDSAAIYQHQAQAQLRAIECGRYILRSANTGISTIIAPNGEILSWIDPLTEGYAVCQVRMLSRNTPYTVVGNLFVFLSIAFCAGLFCVGLVLKKREKQL